MRPPLNNLVVTDLLCIRALHPGSSSSILQFFIILVKKTAWPTMLPVYLIYLTLTYLPTCLLSTPSRMGHSNCFCA